MRKDDTVISRTYADINQGLKDYMIGVYAHMGLGLLITAVLSFFISQSNEIMMMIFNSPLRWIVMFAPLGLVLFLSARINSLTASGAGAIFWIYSALMGVSLSSIFWVFKLGSIAQLFFITASLFGVMSLYGYTTKKDLTSMGSFLIMGVIGIAIASIFNIFFKSSALQQVISVIGVIAFTGLTAYDVQNIKESYVEGEDREIASKKAIFGALQLYLDFINLFISLLYLFGERK